MAVHPRNLLLFLGLAGAAVATYMLSREPVIETAQRVGTEAAPQAYYLLGAVLEGTDDEGRIFNRVFADRVEQLPESDGFALDGIRVEYAPVSNIRWRLTATNGFMPEDRSYFDLSEVQLIQTADAASETMSFETPGLHLDVENMLASTSEPVLFRNGDATIRAIGLTVDLESERYQLTRNATSRSAP